MPDPLCPVLIGREAELGQLRSALAAASSGTGGVVFVTGEAGIGKSRLAAALAAPAVAGAAVVLTGRAVPSAGGVPYRPLTEALLQGLRGRPFPDDPGMAPWLPALRAVIPTIEPGRAGHGELSPAVRGEAVLQLLDRLTGTAATLLVLEDVHWADPDTLAVLEYLGDNLGGAHVLCVATCREEPASAGSELVTRLAGRRAALQVRLGRMTPGESAAMVRACLPSAADELIVRVQRAAEGIPFLIEETLAAPGVPRSFADGVRSRLAGLSDSERLVLDTAALLGRQFDWRLLPAATGLGPPVVEAALAHGVRSQLLAVNDDAFRFRHMLTREALIGELLPPRRADLAARALAALRDAGDAGKAGGRGPLGRPGQAGNDDLEAELAIQAGYLDDAGVLLVSSGRAALARGALATAIGTLRRAAELAGDSGLRAGAEVLLVEALALAGQVDEAMELGDGLVLALPGAGLAETRTAVHLKLAHAAIDGTRWADARRQLGLVADLLATEPDASLGAELDVLRAEVAFAGSDLGAARELAETALAEPAASPSVRCHALELLGRLLRGQDLAAARDSFEAALAIAASAGLPVWRLRALHELGTIEMFDRAGSARLRQAREIADELGAASTGAVIDLQLTACAIFRFDLGEAERRARAALTISSRLGLTKTQSIVLLFLGEVHALRGDRAGMEHYLARAEAIEPGDPEIEGSALAGAHGMLALLENDESAAMDFLRRGVGLLDTLPQQGPAPYRAVWPLLLTATADPGAAAAIAHARLIGLPVNRVNAGILGYADAILAGRRGETELAGQLASAADTELRGYALWADLTRLTAAVPAMADGWGEPRRWLRSAAVALEHHGFGPLAERCRRLLSQPQPSRWARLGITDRQADVLRLVAEGSSNKEIAARLHLSPRTVEKHIEALLRLTAARSRTQLVARAGPEHATDASGGR